MSLLNITLPCTEEELKSAFRAAARRMHPDVGGDPKQFVALNAEYQRLLQDPFTFTKPYQNERTTDYTPLSELGLGLGPTVNGKPCSACASQGYKRVRDSRVTECPECHDTRARLFCLRCDGNGWVRVPDVRNEKCWECKGTGEIRIFNPVLPKGRLTQ